MNDSQHTGSPWLTDKFPYLFTLGVALIAYLTNYLIEITVNSPTIEYNFTVTDENMEGDQVKLNLTCTLTNISTDRAFKELKFFVAPRSISPGIFEEIDILPNSASSPLPTDTSSLNIIGRQAIFNIPKLQPGASYVIVLQIRMLSKEWKLPRIYVQTEDTVRLTEASLLTLLH